MKQYSTRRVYLLFGADGWGLYIEGELIAVVKGQQRAELIASVFEQAAGVDMVGEWTGIYERRVNEHRNHELAVREADEVFARRIASDEEKREEG
jgi:hydrogenase maturation factor